MKRLLTAYLRLPPMSSTIPGALMEALVAHVQGGRVLRTYDFVDVINDDDAYGWQVKSTKSTTPVTWKRAKLPDIDNLIEASRSSAAACQRLGNAILELCNEHAKHSLEQYSLEAIGYARLVVGNEDIRYFERPLVSRRSPILFEPSDYVWHWSKPKRALRKEQLPALQGVHRATDSKWWAWHGQGENQLHFSGERSWWPSDSEWGFRIPALKPEDLISFDQLLRLLDAELPPHR